MRRCLVNVFRLGIKELYSLRYDPVMLFLIVYMFTFAVYEVSQHAKLGVFNAAVAIVDEDGSQLSVRIGDAFLQPYFKRAEQLNIAEIDTAMDKGRYTFVIDIPPGFQADVIGGRQPVVQLNVDATAMSLAGTGAEYIQSIIIEEVESFLNVRKAAQPPVAIVTRARFNANLDSSWFQSVMELSNNITLLAMLLTGAALIREREHGTIEHLLVMPLRPVEIMLAKVWANGLIIIIAATLSLYIVVQGALAVPISGSVPLFVAGATVYLFSATSLGILLATLARSMPQFGLLVMLIFVVMILLSGGNTPLESMPDTMQTVMQFVPSTHFISLAQAVLFRDAGFDVVWPQLAATGVIGAALFLAALLRFRKTVTLTQV